MKIIRIIIYNLAALSLTLTGLFYYSTHHQFTIFTHYVLGYPEMFLSMVFCWLCTMGVIVIFQKENINKNTVISNDLTEKLLESETEKNKIKASFDSEREAYNKLNDAQELLLKRHEEGRLINVELINENTDLAKQIETLQFAMEEQAKAMQEKDAKIEMLIFNQTPNVKTTATFTPDLKGKRSTKAKTKTSKK